MFVVERLFQFLLNKNIINNHFKYCIAFPFNVNNPQQDTTVCTDILAPQVSVWVVSGIECKENIFCKY